MKIENKHIYWIVGIVVLIIGIVFAIKYLDELKENPANTPGEAQKDAEKLEKKMSPTYVNSAYASFADTIHENLKYYGVSSWEDNASKAQEQLEKMMNDLDVAKLIDAFGKRSEYFFGVAGPGQSLFQMVNSNFSSSRLKDVNANWKTKGITYSI